MKQGCKVSEFQGFKVELSPVSHGLCNFATVKPRACLKVQANHTGTAQELPHCTDSPVWAAFQSGGVFWRWTHYFPGL